MKKIFSYLFTLLILLSVMFSAPIGRLYSSAASFADINKPEVFLKQKTSVTCTLSSAAMLMRRTAIAAGYEDWADITEESIRSTAWKEGVGLLWNFTCYDMTIGHGYFDKEKDRKTQILELLKQNPQGFVIYNPGNDGQTHAIFLCDYDKEYDIFYVADPANSIAEGRIPIAESSIYGDTQSDQIDNITAYWYITSPKVTVSGSTSDIVVPNPPEVNGDLEAFNNSRQRIYRHYVVKTSGDTTDAPLRYYPTGSANRGDYVKNGEIVYVTFQGKNKSGATWYKIDRGLYVYSSNLVPIDQYSAETKRFNETAKSNIGTYELSCTYDTRVAVRIEPSEGNNIITYMNNKKYIYVVSEGTNTVGAKWLKTWDGYYVKASDAKFISYGDNGKTTVEGTLNPIRGKYNAVPIEDSNGGNFKPVEYKITASVLNIRKYPVDGEVVGAISRAITVTVTEIRSGWGYITYGGKSGWISLEYAEVCAPNQEDFTIKSMKLSKKNCIVGDSVECTVTLPQNVRALYSFDILDEKENVIFSSKVPTVSNVLKYTVTAPGKYVFSVSATTSVGDEYVGISEEFTAENEIIKSSVVSDTDSEIYVNQELKWTVLTPKKVENVKYTYELYFDSTMIDTVTTDKNEYVIVAENSGEYILKVKCDYGTSSEELIAQPIIAHKELKIESNSLSSNSAIVGGNVSWTCNTTGGMGKVKYVFAIYKDGKLIKNNLPYENNTVSYTFSEEGNYFFYCVVTDSSNINVVAFSQEIKVEDYMLGDLNGDLKVSVVDARSALRFAIKLDKPTERDILIGDVNKDGALTVVDARIIMRVALKIETI